VVKTIFVKNAQKADLSIIEGAMGLFDGVRNQRIKGSSAEIALILGTPVILIVNAEGIAQSLIPLIKGYLNYLTGLNVKGIILNNSSFYHREWVKKSIEEELGVKVLGCLGKNERVKMAERHLGLVPAGENPELRSTIHLLGQWISEELDIDEIIMIAKSSGEIRLEKKEAHLVNKVNNDVAIAIAMDEAFCFCYQDNLDYMHELGADTKYFSPLYDRAIPEADGIYIGGGFPEMFWEQLSGNQSMIQSIIAAYRNRMPIWAECGGFMFLCRQFIDWDGNIHSGVGIIPARIIMTRKLQALGYVEAIALHDSIIAAQGDTYRGHEFHYSTIEGISPDNSGFSLGGYRSDGYVENNLFASYVHLHLRSHPKAARRFIDACAKYKISRTWT
jgi:cobyrinic acid a,c-diamide synthase